MKTSKISEMTANLCRDSFYDFVKEFWHVVVPSKPVWNWHIKYICDLLQVRAERVFEGLPKLDDVLINLPPSLSKSTVCSVMFPAWIWTRMPSARIICASNTDSLATELSRKCRDVTQSEQYVRFYPEIKAKKDQDAKGFFLNTKLGWRFSCTVGGQPPLGYHGDFHIVDDPIDPLKATSLLELAKANHFMTNILPSRKSSMENAFMVLVQQRLHQNDPSGTMLERRASSPVFHVCLPAEKTDYISPPELASHYDRQGGLLDPIRLPHRVLEPFRLGSAYAYSGQYQQRPVPVGGNLFQISRLVYEDETPFGFHRIVRFHDKAGTRDGGCFSANVLLGEQRLRVGERLFMLYWILDAQRKQLDSGEREHWMLNIAKNDISQFGPKVIQGIEEEGGSGGKESAQESATKTFKGMRVRLVRPTKNKAVRAEPISVQVNQGKVRVLRGPWNAPFVQEMEYFPHSTYMDWIDAFSGAFSVHLMLEQEEKANSYYEGDILGYPLDGREEAKKDETIIFTRNGPVEIRWDETGDR